MLSLLSLLENFCNFLSDQTASESSQSLSCLCAFACSPQLLQILFLMLSGFLSLLFPDGYDHCFNLGGSSLQWGVNKEDYNMPKKKQLNCVSIPGVCEYTFTKLYSSVLLPLPASQHHPLRCNLSAQGSSSYQSSCDHNPASPS